MNSSQKTIRQFAIILSWLLVIGIIVSIITSAISLLALTDIFDNDSNAGEFEAVTYSTDKISSLFIDIDASRLEIIAEGNEIKVSTNNNAIKIRESNGNLKIEERSKLINKTQNLTIKIYIPKDKIFEEVEIQAGAGNISIEALSAEELEFSLGAGKTDIDNLTTTKETKISGGTGKFILSSGSLSDTELDWGVGDADISAKLLGETEINSGIGSIELDINGVADDYKVEVSKGIGEITVNGNSVSNGDILGNGKNHIELSNGIGNVKITFSE